MSDTLTTIPEPELLRKIAANARWLFKALEENSALIPANCVVQYAALKALLDEQHNRRVVERMGGHSGQVGEAMSDIGGALREIVRMSSNKSEVGDKIMALWNIPHQYRFQVFAHVHKDVCLETFLEHLTESPETQGVNDGT